MVICLQLTGLVYKDRGHRNSAPGKSVILINRETLQACQSRNRTSGQWNQSHHETPAPGYSWKERCTLSFLLSVFISRLFKKNFLLERASFLPHLVTHQHLRQGVGWQGSCVLLVPIMPYDNICHGAHQRHCNSLRIQLVLPMEL